MKEVPNVPAGTFNSGGSLIFASLVSQGTHQSMNLAHPLVEKAGLVPISN